MVSKKGASRSSAYPDIDRPALKASPFFAVQPRPTSIHDVTSGLNINHVACSALFEYGIARLPIIGNSMYPTLQNGAIVTVSPLTSDKLHIGSCYVFLREGVLVAHRLVWRYGQKAYFAGDNTIHVEMVDKRGIIGKVTAGESDLMRFMTVAMNTLAFVLRSGLFFRCRRKLLRCFCKAEHASDGVR